MLSIKTYLEHFILLLKMKELHSEVASKTTYLV